MAQWIISAALLVAIDDYVSELPNRLLLYLKEAMPRRHVSNRQHNKYLKYDRCIIIVLRKSPIQNICWSILGTICNEMSPACHL